MKRWIIIFLLLLCSCKNYVYVEVCQDDSGRCRKSILKNCGLNLDCVNKESWRCWNNFKQCNDYCIELARKLEQSAEKVCPDGTPK